MDEPRKNLVSLRGASAKEISRDALLEKLSQERELRNFTRKATSASLFIQRVWRRHHAIKLVSLQLQQQWLTMMNTCVTPLNKLQISKDVLRPFFFFETLVSSGRKKFEATDSECVKKCFKVVLQSINSANPDENFCSMVLGTNQERKLWLYQSKKLMLFCLFILAEFDISSQGAQGSVLVSLAMRVAVILTDHKGWKSLTMHGFQVADEAAKDLILFTGNRKNGMYSSVRKYLLKLPAYPQASFSSQTDLITASALTLALRPFHMLDSNENNSGIWETQHAAAAEGFCLFVLTIPCLAQRFPLVLLPALKHKSVLSPCFMYLQTTKVKYLQEVSDLHQPMSTMNSIIPQAAWVLANIIYLVTASDKDGLDSGKFLNGLALDSYVCVATFLAEHILDVIENVEGFGKVNHENLADEDTLVDCTRIKLHGSMVTGDMSFIDFLRPVFQQHHLMGLIASEKGDSVQMSGDVSQRVVSSGKCEFVDVSYYYSCILRIFSVLNPFLGALPVLNMLSFTPGFLTKLWGSLEGLLFPENDHFSSGSNMLIANINNVSEISSAREVGSKWTNILQKITRSSLTELPKENSAGDIGLDGNRKQISAAWDLEPLRHGPEGVSRDISCLLHLFCATYSHLLLVLDDLEFYEKQVPFKLEQQRKIASVLNTFVYNAVSCSIRPQNRPLVDSAVKCLHLLYERDCRHQFCPPDLWLSPGRENRPTVAVAARTHELLSSTVKLDDTFTISGVASVITITPHVFPFEERVEMFREIINMDKSSRRMAGEVQGHGPGSVEIVIRRDHIVEDGFRQLNNLGSGLKSKIHISFVSESGLLEAGLDYGGLSKEFLTDIAKAAFSPEYGLFSQTSTSDGLLTPNGAARFLENGMPMIEFLGQIVGKALYEGILLDYSFSHVFVQKLLCRYSFLDELSTLDPEIYRNLMYVKHYDGDIKELSLDFTVTEELLGKRHMIDLKPGGKDICVTNENKLQYIHAMADYKLNRQILPFANAFCRGLADLISPSWLRLFNSGEFNQLLSGGNHDIDVDDLRKNTRYTGGYSNGSRAVKLFWEVVAGFEPRERCMLLKFVTSCSRGPLLGFKYLQPSFTIHKVACDVPIWAAFGGHDVDRLPSASTCYNTLKVACDVPIWAAFGGHDVDRLPSASTCYNTLKLPTYKRFNTLREKLLYAISSNAGFELS